VEKQHDRSKIKSELFFITVENESPKMYALQIYFLTDRLGVLTYITGYEVMTDGQISAYSVSDGQISAYSVSNGQISAYSVSYCSKTQGIYMPNKEGSRRQR
jgi:hypothetical protein